MEQVAFANQKTIEKVIQMIAEDIIITEKGFLATGDQLQRLSQASKGLIDDASCITTTLSGSKVVELTRELKEEVEHELTRLQNRVHSMTPLIGKISANMTRLRSELKDLKQIASRLHVLGVTSKIEDAKYASDQTDFTLLTQKIESLAEQSESRLTQIENLHKHANQALDASSSDISCLSEIAIKDLDQLRLQLEQTSQTMQGQIDFGQTLSEENAKIIEQLVESTSECVASLQFQDITRQQLEHIQEALTSAHRVSTEPDPVNHPETRLVEEPETISWRQHIVGITMLQEHQIGFSHDELDRALKKLKQHLTTFAEATITIDSNALRLLQSRQPGQTGYLDNLNVRFQEVAQKSQHANSIFNGLQARIQDTLATLRNMMSSLKTISGIGEEIHLIAINAQITAYQYGKRGRTLGVIAESIQKLSNQTRSAVDRFTEDLQEMEGASQEMVKTKLMGDKKREQFDSLIQAILHSTEQEAISLGEMLEAVRIHCEDIQSRVQATKKAVDRLPTLNTLESCRDILRELNRELVKGSSKEVQTAIEQELEELKVTYTMETERRVHQLVASQIKASSTEAEILNQEPVQSEEDWDDIELF